MFVRKDEAPRTTLRPPQSAIVQSDWDVLATYWYPVAELSEIGDGPFKVKLLDVDLVAFKGANGVAIALDRCPHRHIRLSAGEVDDGQIICPYHALRFDETGRCTHVPAVGARAKLPEMYRVQMFPVEIRYGLVWTRLVESEHRPPTFPDIEDCEVLFIKTRTWPVSAARQVENFFDLGHLPIVHGKTLGGSPADPIAPGKLSEDDLGITLTAKYVETPFGGTPRPCTYTYRVLIPFAIDFTVNDDTGHDMKLYDLASPRSAYECRVFQFFKDTRDAGEHHKALIEGLDAVNLEDIEILANITQEDLPLDQRHEIHLQVDNIAHVYRKRLLALGLGK